MGLFFPPILKYAEASMWQLYVLFFISGIPARKHKDRLRQDVIINRLPNILNRIKKLETDT